MRVTRTCSHTHTCSTDTMPTPPLDAHRACSARARRTHSAAGNHEARNVASERGVVCGLRHDVGVVERGVHLAHNDPTLLLRVAHVVVLDLDVLGAPVVHRVVDEIDRPLVVFKDLRRRGRRLGEEVDDAPEVVDFAAAFAQCDILRLAAAERDGALQAAVPRDRRTVEKHDVAGRGLALHGVVGPVRVGERAQRRALGVLAVLKEQAELRGAAQVLQHATCGAQVDGPRPRHPPRQHVHRVRKIGPARHHREHQPSRDGLVHELVRRREQLVVVVV
mmetsp:Transcript_17262/g.53656  ORF Transcript_17262/g.53656 Transcript_17262/m.53656 type:complete len:277 (-) Transcript_17262:3-833(-)